MKSTMWVNLALGIWLVVFAPFLLGGSTLPRVALASHFGVGVLLIVLSAWILTAVSPPAGAVWLEVVCGLWLIVAPFVLGYGHVLPAVAHDIVGGVVVTMAGAITAGAIARKPAAA
jgi:SPW repeat